MTQIEVIIEPGALEAEHIYYETIYGQNKSVPCWRTKTIYVRKESTEAYRQREAVNWSGL